MRKDMVKTVGIGALGLTALIIPVTNLGNYRAEAACAIGWEKVDPSSDWSGSPSVSACDGTSNDGTFASRISDDQIITVTLNNYKGGAFQMKGYGSGLSVKKVIFNLVGENEVTAENGIAFSTSVPTEFTGEGSLKIKALIPVLANSAYVTEDYQEVQVTDLLKDYAAYWSNHGDVTSEITIKPTVKTENLTDEGNNNTDDAGDDEKAENCVNGGTTNNLKKNPWTVEMIMLHAVAGIYILLSLVTFILLGIRKIMRKKQPKEARKTILEENNVEATEEKPEGKK